MCHSSYYESADGCVELKSAVSSPQSSTTASTTYPTPNVAQMEEDDDDDDEDEPVDVLPKLREDCMSSCGKEISNYKACEERIAEKGHGDCESWYFDQLACVDKCVVPQLFEHTK
ncbi:hypothetical protein TL16_g04910 [Triparma laevis f. inornata]|uniref:Ubiquinol-cytochrome C reductase hinge domain-containing protein n=1 Tax=Triparma laevis f. inornata TaxID=1714386 RepID=A0A9W7AHC3_9STRA|nr:hypothetical protein TL16_g04910 [Triparma laevis f. inornata]